LEEGRVKVTEETTLLRDEVARKNVNALVQLMHEHNLFIPARDFPNWRPTQRVSGDIEGVIEAVEIIATDGILAYFLTFDGSVFIGHIQKFTGKVKTLFSVPKQVKATTERRLRVKKKSKRQTMLESL
jgi:hypothetical protein